MTKYYHYEIEYEDSRGNHRTTNVIAKDELEASEIAANEDYYYVGFDDIEEGEEATKEEYESQ